MPATLGDDRPLRLLVGRTRTMSGEEQDRLLAALGELLADWFAEHPDRRPNCLRSGEGPALVHEHDTQEQS
jgi:hypothetical protein